MEYVYAALMLHDAKQPITEDGLKKVVSAAGVAADGLKAKQVAAALEGVNIEDAIKQAAVFSAAPAAAPAGAAAEKKEEKTEAAKEEEAAAGLAALFG